MRILKTTTWATWMGRRLHVAVVGGVLTLTPVASGHDIAAAVTGLSTRENSVLVATRKADTTRDGVYGGDRDSEALDPISFPSDRQPQLARRDAAEQISGGDKRQIIRVAAADNGCEEPATVDGAPEPALFHGIQPGVSTKDQLIEAWGPPKEMTPGENGELLKYQMESFRGVNVLVEEGVVTLMKITLGKPESPEVLAGKVNADPAEGVRVGDENGIVRAILYPERGIVLVVETAEGITPNAKQSVSEMLLQPLDSQSFCLRAEQRDPRQLTLRLADLTQGVKVAPNDAEANWMLAELYLELGRATEAEAAAKLALEADETNPAYRLRWAECLQGIGDYDSAVLETRKVLDTDGVPDLVRAQANHRLGLLASLGDAEIADKAIDFQTAALDQVDKLSTSDDAPTRRAAKRLLVDAHLAIAVEISRRDYPDRLENVAEWVSRASGLAEQAIASGDAGLELRMLVAQQSLAALGNFKPAKDPQPLLEEVLNTVEEIQEQTPEIDPLWLEQIHWNTGIAYLHAVQINHQRGLTKLALEHADRAVEYLATAAEQRRDSPATQQLIGRLYFHIGALHAVHKEDHAEAVTWYDKAAPLLTAEAKPSELFVPRREGEALVSMAVSFWSEGERERAVELTEAGTRLIEKGVDGGVLDEGTLEIPYSNLATMHKLLGNTAKAEEYTKLADALQALTAEQARKAGQASTPRPKAPTPRGKQQAANATTPQQQAATPSRTAVKPQAKPTTQPQRSLDGRSSRSKFR